MTPLLKLLVGISVILVLGIVTMKTQVFPGSLLSARDQLQEQSVKVISTADASWASIEFDGQKAVLSGMAPSTSSLDAVVSSIKGATWTGGLFVGGVTAVDSSSVVIESIVAEASPLKWQAVSEDGNVILSGYVPSAVTRISVSQLTTKLFPLHLVTGDLEVIKSTIDEDDWRSAISMGLEALSLLETGTLHAEATKVSIRGTPKDQAQSDEVKRLMATMPEGFRSEVELSLLIPPVETTVVEIQEPEISTEDIQPPAQNGEDQIANVLMAEAEQSIVESENAATEEVESCTVKLQPLVTGKHITFERGRDVLNDESRNFLRELATAMSDCPSAVLTITGHTDSTGRETNNRRLSLKRANTAAAQLHSLGLDEDRIQTFGVGSQMPQQQNATERGRAINRRIEFDISYEQSQD